MINALVTIIMPAYNAARYLEEAIQSVIIQTFKNWELIIVNDGSTDSTPLIAAKMAASDERIKLINKENNKLSAARNTGIGMATGKWIAFLDADDIWNNEKLKMQLLAATAYPEAGLIFCDGFIFTNGFDNLIPYGAVSGLLDPTTMYRLEYQGNYIPVLSVLVKKMHVTAIGLMDENLRACEDWDYWLRLAGNGVSFYGMKNRLFYYRKHNDNMSNDDELMQFSKAYVLLKNFRPEIFNTQEQTILKSFVHITICKLIKTGKIGDALQLSRKLPASFSGTAGRFVPYLIGSLKRYAYYPVRSVIKADMLFSKITAHV